MTEPTEHRTDTSAPADPLTAAEIEAARSATPGIEHVTHMNHAGSSLPSHAVLNTQLEHLKREATIGGYEAAAERADDNAAVYASIATLIGADETEIARLEHATAAWNAAFWSVPMEPGQRILTARAAYGANAIGFLRAVERRGVTIDVVPDDEHGQVDVAQVAARLDDDVALVALTHVPTNGGLVNPAEAVGQLTRSAGVPFLLDACQSVGQLDLDVDRLGCDLLSATGRKYLRGPRGSGFLYASAGIVDRLIPAQPDHHGADWTTPSTYALADDARRFEYWEYNHAAWLGLGTAVDEALERGTDRIEATVVERATQLREALTAAGYRVMDLGQRRCGIVTVDVPQARAVQAMLRSKRINTSVTSAASTRFDAEARGLEDMLRVSVHYLTTVAEIEIVIDALNEATSSLG